MGHQIVKQPNGKYAVWSSVLDDFILTNAIPEQIIEDECNLEREKIAEHTRRIIDQLEKGEKPYYQSTLSFEECVEMIQDFHGNDATSLQSLEIAKEENE